MKDERNMYLTVGLNKKVPRIIGGFATVEEAEAYGTASDDEDFTVVLAEKLGDSFSTAQLAEIFNALPGEDPKVERFSDKPSAVKRVMARFEQHKETIMATHTTRKKSKATKQRAAGPGRPRAKLEGRIKALKRAEKRWKTGTARSAAYELLADSGAQPVEDFVALAMKKLKLERGAVLGIIGKLRTDEMVEVG